MGSSVMERWIMSWLAVLTAFLGSDAARGDTVIELPGIARLEVNKHVWRDDGTVRFEGVLAQVVADKSAGQGSAYDIPDCLELGSSLNWMQTVTVKGPWAPNAPRVFVDPLIAGSDAESQMIEGFGQAAIDRVFPNRDSLSFYYTPAEAKVKHDKPFGTFSFSDLPLPVDGQTYTFITQLVAVCEPDECDGWGLKPGEWRAVPDFCFSWSVTNPAESSKVQEITAKFLGVRRDLELDDMSLPGSITDYSDLTVEVLGAVDFLDIPVEIRQLWSGFAGDEDALLAPQTPGSSLVFAEMTSPAPTVRVPEPSAFSLLGICWLTIMCLRRRKPSHS